MRCPAQIPQTSHKNPTNNPTQILAKIPGKLQWNSNETPMKLPWNSHKDPTKIVHKSQNLRKFQWTSSKKPSKSPQKSYEPTKIAKSHGNPGKIPTKNPQLPGNSNEHHLKKSSQTPYGKFPEKWKMPWKIPPKIPRVPPPCMEVELSLRKSVVSLLAAA